jgi:hypothetical protein
MAKTGWVTASVIAAVAALGVCASTGEAASGPGLTVAKHHPHASEFSAQRRPRYRRARTRIDIYRAPSVIYPGPNAVRQCRSWLEPEWRASGTVIVPRMRCWWQLG